MLDSTVFNLFTPSMTAPAAIPTALRDILARDGPIHWHCLSLLARSGMHSRDLRFTRQQSC
jgi:hypothetical protein